MLFQIGDLVVAKEFLLFQAGALKIPKYTRGRVIQVVENAATMPVFVPPQLLHQNSVNEPTTKPQRPFEIQHMTLVAEGDFPDELSKSIETRFSRPDHVFVRFEGSELPSGTSGEAMVDVAEKDIELLLRPS